jgi:hypothetical protein
MKYDIITIERQYASGGFEIGQMVADKLEIPLYGREIMEMAAAQEALTMEDIEHMEETATNSLLYSIAMKAKMASVDKLGIGGNKQAYLAEATVVNGLADKGSSVFIGHCAGCILRERDDVLRVFIHADENKRRYRAITDYGIEPNMVDRVMNQYDKRRANYYRANSDRRWDDYSAYHLVLNSGEFSLEECADIITAAAGLK